MSILVFWVVTPYELVGRYQRFGGTYYLHLQGNIDNVIAVRSSDLIIIIIIIIIIINLGLASPYILH
jgi:hypothetical protein